MNKAFVREPEGHDGLCPRCSSIGAPVPAETLVAFLSAEQRRTLSPTANFCPLPSCEVVYFDHLERYILAADLATPVYPKDAAAAICPCFGFTCDEIDLDVQEGGVTRTRAAVERAKSEAAQCRTKSPTGRPCVADVQKYFMQRRQEAMDNG